jgi:hypothetical protein
MTPSGIEPATFRLVAQYPNHCAIAVTAILSDVANTYWGANDSQFEVGERQAWPVICASVHVMLKNMFVKILKRLI